MQRLEVSGAVRPLYGSLDAKGLRCIFRKSDVGVWTGLSWPRIGTDGEHL